MPWAPPPVSNPHSWMPLSLILQGQQQQGDRSEQQQQWPEQPQQRWQAEYLLRSLQQEGYHPAKGGASLSVVMSR